MCLRGCFLLGLSATLATVAACGGRVLSSGPGTSDAPEQNDVEPAWQRDVDAGSTPPDAMPSTGLTGVDTTSLSQREFDKWWAYVSTYLAPCPSVPVSIAVCVQEARPCPACLFAARFLAGEVRKGHSDTTVDAAYRIRFSQQSVSTIDLQQTPAKGAAKPLVTIVEFADYQCPFCKTTDGPLSAVVQKHPDSTALYFKNYPLPYHSYAKTAAVAGVAANSQGKFWEMHDALFQSAPNLAESDIQRCAQSIGLDVTRFDGDRKAAGTIALVERDVNQGDALKIAGTPTIFINGRRFDLTLFDLSADLEAWVQMEIDMMRTSETR